MGRKIVAVLLCIILGSQLICACANTIEVRGKEYRPYGLLSTEMKEPEIEYRFVWSSLIFGTITLLTMIGGEYFLGFNLYEPVGERVDK